MAEWIDLALAGDEASLTSAIAAMDAEEQSRTLASLTRVLALGDDEIVANLIRLLVEQVRPLALPASLWSRPVTASDDPRTHVRNHFRRRSIAETPDRLKAALSLYRRFAQVREDRRLTEADLRACGYRCSHCGMAFCNEQLESRGFISIHGPRGRDKRDDLKPHWNAPAEMRIPTIDHDWPVSLYGDNTTANLRVFCGGCNHAKRDVLAMEQTREWIGLPSRDSLLKRGAADWGAFYTQIRHSPTCYRSGMGSRDVELTVELIDPDSPAVLGNLQTVTSKGL